MNVGQSASLAPDYGKATKSAQRIFQLLDRKPRIDSYSEEGEKLVRVVFFCLGFFVCFCFPEKC